MSNETQDLYEILQVRHEAAPEEIQAAYKRLMRRYHPDVNKSPDAHAVTVGINTAYETLMDPNKRFEYDRARAANRTPFLCVVEKIEKFGHNTTEKGRLFEYLTKGFLENDVEFSNRFKKVWLWSEYPGRGNRPDTGVDIVAEDIRGRRIAIQCKYRSKPESRLSRNDMSEFLAELGTRDYDEGIIFSTVDRLSKNADENLKRLDKKVVHVGFKELEDSSIDWTSFDVQRPDNLKCKRERVQRERTRKKREATYRKSAEPTINRRPTPPPHKQHAGNWQTQTRHDTLSFSLPLIETPLMIAIVIAAILIITGIVGIVLFAPAIGNFFDALVNALVAVLFAAILFLFRAVAIILLIALILGALYAAVRHEEPELGLVAGVAICIFAGILLTHGGAKAFLVSYLSEDYAAYMFLGGIIVAFIGGFRKFGDRY